jgi:hypothetical protein
LPGKSCRIRCLIAVTDDPAEKERIRKRLWLSKQLPAVAFFPEVEDMFMQAATLSYRTQIAAKPPYA